jgi:hypothetical protein
VVAPEDVLSKTELVPFVPFAEFELAPVPPPPTVTK